MINFISCELYNKKRERRKYKREAETLRGPISPETFLGHLPSDVMFLKTVLPFLLQDCNALRAVTRPNSHPSFLGLRSKFLRHPCLLSLICTYSSEQQNTLFNCYLPLRAQDLSQLHNLLPYWSSCFCLDSLFLP